MNEHSLLVRGKKKNHLKNREAHTFGNDLQALGCRRWCIILGNCKLYLNRSPQLSAIEHNLI